MLWRDRCWQRFSCWRRSRARPWRARPWCPLLRSPSRPGGGGIAIIPAPAVAEPGPGRFRFGPSTAVHVVDAAFDPVARRETGRLRLSTGLPLPLVTGDADIVDADIVIAADRSLPAEGYRLAVSRDTVRIHAADAAGLFYAFQSIRQLLPPEVEYDTQVADVDWSLPAVDISDHPRFPWRGMHLDVARHFFDVASVKRYIDLMARYKFNRFHWHLTDDQGWRIAIDAWPRLTDIGAWRSETAGDGIPHGGFYTQQQIREVVAYAAERFVTVIPGIEMPGHASAALAAYPQYGCRQGVYEVATTWGVKEDVFCPSEATFRFLEDVLGEVIRLFPGEYVHIGVDEVRKTQWQESRLAQDLMSVYGLADEDELQSHFVRRITAILQAHGRRPIGWDEILEGGLTGVPHVTVMSWRGMSGGIEAARRGHDVIMTPKDYTYFNYYQGHPITEPLAARPGYRLPLAAVYAFEPVPDELSEREAAHILGAQGNVWTEFIGTPEQLEYMAYPRALALSEALWSPPARRSLAGFYRRLRTHIAHLDALGVNYRTPAGFDPVVRSTWNLHLDGDMLFYLKEPCVVEDTRGRFLLHLFPADPDDLGGARAKQGFNTLNFDFDRYGVRYAGRCLIRRQLPAYRMTRLRTGQWIPGGSRIWHVEIPLPS